MIIAKCVYIIFILINVNLYSLNPMQTNKNLFKNTFVDISENLDVEISFYSSLQKDVEIIFHCNFSFYSSLQEDVIFIILYMRYTASINITLIFNIESMFLQ